LLNASDISWIMVATALVMFMTPGLGFFYGGLVRRKNILSTIIQCMVIFAVVSLVWALWGYTLVFGPTVGGWIGNLANFGLNGVTDVPNPNYGPTIPELLQFAFQLKFAAITPALIIGAFVERIRFKSLLIFIIAWSTLIYSPIAHWVWNVGGWLHLLGTLDFAGGIVIHAAAGLSALAAALVIGRRQGLENSAEMKPSNIPYVILGGSILWFGWFGFNAGSALAADTVAVYALVNTNLAAAAAAVSWMAVDWMGKGRPSVVGLTVGAVCGLAAVTPASGYVAPWAAILIGFTAGIVSNLVSNWRASRLKVDDSLDVFACHGVGGILGSLATGLFATIAVNPAGANGLLYGNTNLFFAQFVGIAVVGAYAFIGTYILLKVINVFSPLRVSAEEEEKGLDLAEHGEEAYNQQD
jgi:ammonium transporter, Amt family